MVHANSHFNGISSISPMSIVLSAFRLTEAHCSTRVRVFESSDDEDDGLFASAKKPVRLPMDATDFVDQIFEKYEDGEANFLSKFSQPTGSKFTPNVKQPRDDEISKYKISPRRSLPKYESHISKTKRVLANVEGRKDFCEILEHVGVDSKAYLANVFSSKKKIRPKFGCSTPISNGRKPDVNDTLTPFDCFRKMTSPLNLSTDSSWMTPVAKINGSIKNLERCETAENLKMILLGITCYVEVKTGKEDQSESCRNELRAIGASVGKKFTKKVTHVVFKEGRMYTYRKAKDNNIPIVSVLWIEACKLARGPVDPALYPPARMEKYQRETPFSVILDRTVKRIFRECFNNRDVPVGSYNLQAISSRRQRIKTKAVTDLKENRKPKSDLSWDRPCTKKLDFVDNEHKDLGDKVDLLTINDSCNLSDTSIMEQLKLNALPKRRSAPGALAKKKRTQAKRILTFNGDERKRPEQISPVCDTEVKQTDEYVTPKRDSVQAETDRSEKQKLDNFLFTSTTKKRKLFDPCSSHVLQNSAPQLIDDTCPYPDLPPVLMKIDVDGKKKDGPTGIDQSSAAGNSLESSHAQSSSSISFLDPNTDKAARRKYKPSCSIVFTGFPSVDSAKLAAIVRKLGTFEVEELVSDRTSHVVGNGTVRTLNLLRGIARGCWIVSNQWLYQSEACSRWLAEEHFELRAYSPAVSQCRLQKQVFKQSFRMDLFSSFGPLYVSSNSRPEKKDLIELIKLCGGRIASCARGAKLLVGDRRTVRDEAVVKVREKWILDSIFRNQCLDLRDYIIK